MSLLRLWEDSDAVLFDFDGVLADSEPFYRMTWNSAIFPAGPISEREYFFRWSFMGEGDEHLAEMGFDPGARQVLRERQRGLYSALCHSGAIPLCQDAPALLEWVSVRKPCIIASNTDSDLVSTVLRTGGSLVPKVVGGEGLKHKPHPDIFQRAASVLGFKPERCLVVEDAWKGIEAARRGGFPAVLIRTPRNMGFPSGPVPESQGLEHLFKSWRGEEES